MTSCGWPTFFQNLISAPSFPIRTKVYMFHFNGYLRNPKNPGRIAEFRMLLSSPHFQQRIETESTKLGKDAKIAELQTKLAAYENVDDVQLCKKDTAKDNANLLLSTFPEEKLLAMVKAILIDLER